MTRPGSVILDLVDPRSRIVGASMFCLLVAVANRPEALLCALGAAGCGALLGGLSPATAVKRLAPLNSFMFLLILVMPLTISGTSLWSWGPLSYSVDGLRWAGMIAVKGNAIVLMLAGLVGTLPLTTLGHALSHLHMPDKLAHLLLFTVRYLGVLRREYGRLNMAIRLRGFRPRANLHTYRTYSYLIGMLLIRGLDRSERVLAAMKCRAFHGHFYLLDHFHYSRRDLAFVILLTTLLAGLALLEWL